MKSTFQRWVCAATVICIGFMSSPAQALVVASDDASAAIYDNGWQVGDNGGTGFAPWSTINNQAGSGSGGGFLASNNSNSQIGTGAPSESFGIFGNGGGVGQAIRAFSSVLSIGHEFSIDMDNGFIDNGKTVGFGLQNSSGDNLFEFFFVGGESSYKVNRLGGSAATGDSFTNTGLRVKLILTDADSFSFTVDKLSDGIGTNVTTITGDLLSPAGGQAISQLRLFNADAGFGGDHDAFFNSMVVTAVPEASAVWCGAIAMAAGVAVVARRRPVAVG